jgi:hypothetical protein
MNPKTYPGKRKGTQGKRQKCKGKSEEKAVTRNRLGIRSSAVFFTFYFCLSPFAFFPGSALPHGRRTLEGLFILSAAFLPFFPD